MSHAYYFIGEREKGIAVARRFVQSELGNHVEIVELRYGLLSVKEARELPSLAYLGAGSGNAKALIIAVDRFFHEAQNALLKLFEEPPEGTYLFLVVPSEGNLLATLRSRMVALSSSEKRNAPDEVLIAFLEGTPLAREKLIAHLLEDAKSDDDAEKQRARICARTLAEGLLTASYMAYQKEPREELLAFIDDLSVFVPILHERAAPLKQIFEHILLVTPLRLVQ